MPRKPSLKKRVCAVLTARAEAKILYAKSDILLAGLVEVLPLGQPIPIGAGKAVMLVDQFAEKGLVWGHAAVRRFELKEVTDGA